MQAGKSDCQEQGFRVLWAQFPLSANSSETDQFKSYRGIPSYFLIRIVVRMVAMIVVVVALWELGGGGSGDPPVDPPSASATKERLAIKRSDVNSFVIGKLLRGSNG